MKRRALIVELPVQVYARVMPILSELGFSADRLTRVRGASSLVLEREYDLILAGFPLKGSGIEDLFGVLRWHESPCLHTPLMLFVYRGEEERARPYIGVGVSRVVPMNAASSLIRSQIDELLNIAPRLNHRVSVRLIGYELGRRSLILCHTVNLSATGMLVHTGRRFDVGDQVSFELLVPGHKNPITGRAEIIRHTRARREAMGGMAVKFLSFEEDGEAVLTAFIRSRGGEKNCQGATAAPV